MARNIILALLAFLLIALLGLWILSGGPRRVIGTASNAARGVVPTEEELSGFRLPWQPAQLFPTLDITDVLDLAADEPRPSAQDRLIALEAEYDKLNAQAQDLRTFGSPSPHVGKVTIMQDISGVRAPDAQDEYLQIAANYANEASIDLSGWVLESALTGTRIAIPAAASPYVANTASAMRSVVLKPGDLALVTSSASPVGVSFRENMCSGYLQQFQSFSPPLADECPSPSQILPLTSENLQRYGDTCFDAINNLPQCRFPQSLPAEISGACRTFLTEFLSYNGCVNQNRHRSTFESNVWRLYLGSGVEIWRNSHDAVRLLDAQGKTVSVFVY
jgi:hypothetical protein